MMVDLISVKKSFSTVVEDVPPWIFSHFMMWLDLKVAEYKVYGYMLMDEESKKTGHSSRKRNDFVRFVSDTGPHQSNRAEGTRQRLSDAPDDSTNISTSKSQTSSVQHGATTSAFSSPLKRTSNITQETRFGQKTSSQSETKTSDQSETNRNNITTLDFSDMKIDPQTDTQVSQSDWSESVVPLDPSVYKSDQSELHQRTGSFSQHETKFDQDIKDVNVQHDISVFSDSVPSQNESDIPLKQPRVEASSAIAADHQSNRNIRNNPETSTAQRSFGQGSSYNVGAPILHSPSKDNGIFSASHSVGSNSGQQPRSGYTSASGETSFMVCDARTMHPIWHSQANETMSTTGQFGDRHPLKCEQFSQGSSSSGYQTQKSQVHSGNSTGNSPVGDISSLQTLIKIEIDSDESQEPCMMMVSQSADKTGSQSFYHPGTELAGQAFSSGTSHTQNQTLYLEPISGTTSDEGINQLIGEAVNHPSERDMQSTSTAHDDSYGQLTPIYDSLGVRIGYRRKLHKDPVTGKYSCLQCGAQFANQSSLSRHRALHGEKKHSMTASLFKVTPNTKHHTLEDAITAVQEGGMSQRMATKVFGVPRTTLQYHLNRSKLYKADNSYKGDNSSFLSPDSDGVSENVLKMHDIKIQDIKIPDIKIPQQ
ncbi:hypothetical protein CHS0354_022052 [Potamilus streckersoni]|uniref:C2H2-type domain-containing protein n=1 Tax=Potamilus streckersoni TaxID=2493646 RepID=A0AAE0W0W6_9BIVA|nr:hypothetical protein CHS0354_022052 [Potamilus streckersoni]